uniref:G_PROTEIN_RECEP_F1_2 domain-containing protein n=1 Tax=Syphacia muris TaxID=451379 RepID=A0A158R5H1_9BILA
MTERTWIPRTICYHEPKVHDYQLYFQLTKINLYFLLPFAILGTIFNSAALICLYNPPRISSGVFIYLRALLILDHCQIIMTSSAAFIPQFCDNHHSPNHTFYQFCMFERRFMKHLLPRLETTINGMHFWMVAALSTHRYWKISRPVISRIRDTAVRAQTIIITMLCVAAVYRAPTFLLELELKKKPTWRIQRRPEMTQVLSLYRLIYHSIIDPALSNLVPFIWMAIFSLLTLYEIFRSRDFTYRRLYFHFNDSKDRHATFATCFSNRAENMRQRQEWRATVSVILIILLYLVFHSLQFYNVIRKWQLLINAQCPTRTDYVQSEISNVLSMFSASVNAFVYIAFTNRLQRYIRQIMRRTSRSLSTSTDPPLSPPPSTVALEHPLTSA